MLGSILVVLRFDLERVMSNKASFLFWACFGVAVSPEQYMTQPTLLPTPIYL
jgi:hypothetical protein